MKTDGSDQNTKGRQNGKGPDEGVRTLQHEIARMAEQFKAALPKTITPERMIRIVLTAIRKNPELALCPSESFFGAVLTGLQLGLEINTPLGQCYIIPYNREITFQLGYQGILELAYRSNKYKRIEAEVVYKGDEFKYEYGLDAHLKHKPGGSRENPQYVYAMYELVNGGKSFKVWTWEAVIKHAQSYSKSFSSSSSPWKSSNQETVEGMAKKTLLISLLKYAPKSVEIAQAISADETDVQAKIVEDGSYSFVDFEFRQPQVKDDRDNPDRIREKTPGAEKAEREAAQGGEGQEEDPVPAARNQRKTKTEIAGFPYPKGGGKAGGLFSRRDEEESMEEQYQREQAGVYGPDFGN